MVRVHSGLPFQLPRNLSLAYSHAQKSPSAYHCPCFGAAYANRRVDLRFLENKLQRQLQRTRRVVGVGYDDFAESCALNRVGCGGVILIVSDKVARCVRQVESLRAKLQLNPFRQSEILEDRKIEMPEGRTIQAVTRRVSDRAERRNNKSAVLNHSPMLGLERVASAIWFGRVGPPPIPLKTELAKPVKLSVMVNGLPEFQIENRIGLPSRERQFFGSGEVLAKRQLIGDGADKAMAEIKVAIAGFSLLDGEGICVSKALLALIAQSRGIVDRVRVSVVDGYGESVMIAALERCLQRVIAGTAYTLVFADSAETRQDTRQLAEYQSARPDRAKRQER